MARHRIWALLAMWSWLAMAAVVGFAAENAEPPPLVAPTEALSPEEQQAKFHLPPGFEIQLVACEPDIHKPMNLNFDSRGRLYVTHSLEYPYPAKESPRDAITRLEDFDATGRARKLSHLVQGLNIPIGVVPVGDDLIYYSIPSIYRGRDTDGDGRFDEQRELYSEFGYRDTHGMASSFTRWLDGWIYCCHGFSNQSQVKGADGQVVSMQSGNTFRMRADGSHVEQVTHGQVNPFGLAFDPLGNMYTADCHTLPIYQLLRGAYYPSFGKPHDGLGYGPTMISHDHGSTGIAGVVYYAADHFPPEWRDTVFIGNPVTGRVNHDRLDPHGSSLMTVEMPDFIACDDLWFRPVDIKLGPDGALYIADFYNCIIGHYEVRLDHPRRDREKGRIWRVIYRGDGKQPAPALPNLAALDEAGLIDRLGDVNLTVRTLATEELVARDPARTAAAWKKHATGKGENYRRVHFMWAWHRMLAGATKKQAAALKIPETVSLPSTMRESDRLLRVHAVKLWAERSLAELYPGESVPTEADIRKLLADSDAFVRRAAADALGRRPAFDNVAPLLKLWDETAPDDTHLIHVARMALRDHLLVPGMYAKLADLTQGDENQAAKIAELSLGVRTEDSADYLLAFLEERPRFDRELAVSVHDVVRYLPENRLAEGIALALAYEGSPFDLQQAVLLATHRGLQERGAPASEDLRARARKVGRQLLAAEDRGLVQSGLELARELRLADLFEPVAAHASSGARFADLRPAAIDACAACDAGRAAPLFAQIIAAGADVLPVRQKAAGALASLNLPEADALLLAQLVAAPERLAIEIAAGLASRKPTAELLMAQVEAGKVSARLLQERVVQERLRGAGLEDWGPRVAKLTAGLPAAEERVQRLIESRRQRFAGATPHAAAGAEIFKKHCASCHRVGGQGSKVGPDLDGIGIRGVDRLLEDTLDPSSNVDQAFRATVINTKGGQSIVGLLLREEGEVLVLADNMGKEIRVSADDIDERDLTRLSPMPGNVADLVGEADFDNLLAFLLAQKQALKKE